MKEISIEAKIENIEKVTDFINDELDLVDCSIKSRVQIDIAIDEIFSNISNYAYEDEIGMATVQIQIDNELRQAILTFIDNGKCYDPSLKEDPDVTLNAEDREIGGLGIFIVKKSMDSLTYEYTNNQNVLTIVKSL